MPTTSKVLDWLAEPSTVRGLAGVLVTTGLISMPTANLAITLGAAIVSLVELVRRE